jgi:hypothetical protein
MSTASAAPRPPRRVEPPERSPAAIRAELPESMRAQFDAVYLAALEEARTSYRLDRLAHPGGRAGRRPSRSTWARCASSAAVYEVAHTFLRANGRARQADAGG